MTDQRLTAARARSLEAIEDGVGDLLSYDTLGILIGLDLAWLDKGWPLLTDAGREALEHHRSQE